MLHRLHNFLKSDVHSDSSPTSDSCTTSLKCAEALTSKCWAQLPSFTCYRCTEQQASHAAPQAGSKCAVDAIDVGQCQQAPPFKDLLGDEAMAGRLHLKVRVPSQEDSHPLLILLRLDAACHTWGEAGSAHHVMKNVTCLFPMLCV